MNYSIFIVDLLYGELQHRRVFVPVFLAHVNEIHFSKSTTVCNGLQEMDVNLTFSKPVVISEFKLTGAPPNKMVHSISRMQDCFLELIISTVSKSMQKNPKTLTSHVNKDLLL